MAAGKIKLQADDSKTATIIFEDGFSVAGGWEIQEVAYVGIQDIVIIGLGVSSVMAI